MMVATRGNVALLENTVAMCNKKQNCTRQFMTQNIDEDCWSLSCCFNYFEDIWTNAKKPIKIKNPIKRKIEKFVDVLFTIDNMAMAPIRHHAGWIGATQQSKAAKKSGSLWKENF